MSRKYRKERDLKSTNKNPHPPEILQHLDTLTPQELWEVCRPLPTLLEGLTEEEQFLKIQDSRIVVFELLARRFGELRLELRGDTLYPLELKLDYSDPLPLDPKLESYPEYLTA